jgi:DNA-directed RNA polymerase specialized sigma24 family protein
VASNVLSAHERDLLIWRSTGITHSEIANGLCLTPSAVDDRVKRARQKVAAHEAKLSDA